jgi:methionyl-tRNA synthetase
MSSKSEDNLFYITTAIDYSNAVPHLGHAFEKIGADVICRYQRFLGKDVFFLTGTDEHSQNVKRIADEQDISPKEYCDKMAEKFKQVWSALSIDYSNFIQTTDPLHKNVVQTILGRLYENDDIYKDLYKGKYCGSCEKFLNNEEILDDKLCKTHEIKLQNVEEENYFFKLKKYQSKLLSHIKKHPEFIQPDSRRNEILSLLEKGLEDVSISRQGSDWGIPLPFDKKSVTYVWVDALTNYISGLGGIDAPNYEKYWPANLHIIGKDITRFHCVIWPCMLMSAGIELPKEVWGHGFVHMDGSKMSKTKGTGINPIDLASQYGPDSLRYYLMREIAWDSDGDFNIDRLIERHNAELSHGMGNVVSRIHKMIVKYFNGTVHKSEKSVTEVLVGTLRKKISAYYDVLNKYELSQGLEICNDMLREINLYLDGHKPWKLIKEEGKQAEVEQVLFESLTGTLLTAICLAPYCPQKMAQVLEVFHLDPNITLTLPGLNTLFDIKTFKTTPELTPIFPLIDTE